MNPVGIQGYGIWISPTKLNCELFQLQVQLKQKLVTVFSSSKYCNGSNEAACVLIDNKKLRVIRLDTS